MTNAGARRGGSTVTEVLLRPLLAAQTHRPRLVWYGMGRTELSTASLANWSAKVAGLLDDELGLRPPACVSILARPNWQVMPIVLGTWWAGFHVVEQGMHADAVFADLDHEYLVDEGAYILSGHPLAASIDDLADGLLDFTDAVLPQADRYAPHRPIRDDAGAIWRADDVEPQTIEQTVTNALEFGRRLGDRPRLLTAIPVVDDGTYPIVDALLGALAADGTLVVVDELWKHDPVSIAAAEKATITVGLELPGLPRLET